MENKLEDIGKITKRFSSNRFDTYKVEFKEDIDVISKVLIIASTVFIVSILKSASHASNTCQIF